MTDRDPLKDALRQRMKTIRALLGPEADALARRAAERVLGLPEVQRARLVLCYVSVRRELSTTPLLIALLEAGKPMAVPRIEGDLLRAGLLEGLDGLTSGPFGVPTCAGPDVTDSVDVCITPGLAFGPHGERLGYGGGYYDRFLGAHPNVLPIGLCYESQLVEGLPMHPHDHPMAIVVTPARVIRARTG